MFGVGRYGWSLLLWRGGCVGRDLLEGLRQRLCGRTLAGRDHCLFLLSLSWDLSLRWGVDFCPWVVALGCS